MTKTLFTSKGKQIAVGRQLGKGGEGSVHEVPALTDQVAKLYHKAPDQMKQTKLSFMASTADAQLLNYIAWPQDTLHYTLGGPIVGFLMPKVSGKAPVHMIYSPAHRRQDYPKSAWDFLLYVARNIAASFQTVHSHGHVIGDVNQDSFMVGRDSKVILIDSDSFQVNAKGTMHLCEVGVSHFTPPELQSLSSFSGFTRTINHDNFGLALLIFHLLFGGRHPFSGVPLRKGVGDALESDIKNYRYAYARDNQSRGITPPPRSIPVEMLPDAISSMFFQAFTERGASGGRPSAKEWVTALDGLRSRLKKCSTSSMHIYPDHLKKCSWCSLEQQGVVYFMGFSSTYVPKSTGFLLAETWGLVLAIAAPTVPDLPSPNSFQVKAQPLPDGLPNEDTISNYRFVSICVAIGFMLSIPEAWFLGLIIGLVGWVMSSNAGSSERHAERLKRRDAKKVAQQVYNQLVEQVKEQLKNEIGPKKFLVRRAELVKIKEELDNLPSAEKYELDRLETTANERQKQKFLDAFFIDKASISGVGPARKAALRSFGIETAADVTSSRVMQVDGFGDSLTRSLLDWKASCARRFKFNAAAGVSDAERNAVRSKYFRKRVILEQNLTAGPEQLRQLKQKSESRFALLKPHLEAAAQKLAQTQADCSLLP